MTKNNNKAGLKLIFVHFPTLRSYHHLLVLMLLPSLIFLDFPFFLMVRTCAWGVAKIKWVFIITKQSIESVLSVTGWVYTYVRFVNMTSSKTNLLPNRKKRVYMTTRIWYYYYYYYSVEFFVIKNFLPYTHRARETNTLV